MMECLKSGSLENACYILITWYYESLELSPRLSVGLSLNRYRDKTREHMTGQNQRSKGHNP